MSSETSPRKASALPAPALDGGRSTVDVAPGTRMPTPTERHHLEPVLRRGDTKVSVAVSFTMGTTSRPPGVRRSHSAPWPGL